jgi:hypothetical protein
VRLQKGLPLASVCQVLGVHPCEVDGNVEDCIIGQPLESMTALLLLLVTERTGDWRYSVDQYNDDDDDDDDYYYYYYYYGT